MMAAGWQDVLLFGLLYFTLYYVYYEVKIPKNVT